MPFFTPKLFLKKPTEMESLDTSDYNDNLDIIDHAIQDHLQDNTAHGLGSTAAVLNSHLVDRTPHIESLNLYRLNKDAFGKFTELQWKRADGTLAKRLVLGGGIPPNYLNKTVTYYEEDGTTVRMTKVYLLSYDQENEVISEVMQ
ncbi:hypothetical protein [Dehalobacter sp. TBBPA1]|uniref:hypothetical protein n=1 Tax=Dehalobacter sp. TBBPA1 TaxID=3235037 RepID=UPI0034A38B00